MFLISLNLDSNMSHASEDLPSLELLELLGQFEQQDEAWVNNELGVENESDFKNETSNELQKPDKQDSSEYINE